MQAAGIAAPDAAPAVFLVLSGERAERTGLALAERLRDALPGLGVLVNMDGGSFKAQLKRADKSGAELAVIIGDDEVARGIAAVKPLRAGTEQQECGFDQLPARIAAWLSEHRMTGKDDGR
jgi:histidyl-tRNA synthetase